MISPELYAAALRDFVALTAPDTSVEAYRGRYDDPRGGSKILYKFTKEQARYFYADAIMAAREVRK